MTTRTEQTIKTFETRVSGKGSPTAGASGESIGKIKLAVENLLAAWYPAIASRAVVQTRKEAESEFWAVIDAALAAAQARAAGVERDVPEGLRDRVLEAWSNYERMGEVCSFEGQPMIYASTLEELAQLAAAPSPAAAKEGPIAGVPASALSREHIDQQDSAQQGDALTYTVDGVVMSQLEYIDYLHGRLDAATAAPVGRIEYTLMRELLGIAESNRRGVGERVADMRDLILAFQRLRQVAAEKEFHEARELAVLAAAIRAMKRTTSAATADQEGK